MVLVLYVIVTWCLVCKVSMRDRHVGDPFVDGAPNTQLTLRLRTSSSLNKEHVEVMCSACWWHGAWCETLVELVPNWVTEHPCHSSSLYDQHVMVACLTHVDCGGSGCDTGESACFIGRSIGVCVVGIKGTQ